MRDRSAREGPARGARGPLSGSRIARLARTATATTGEPTRRDGAEFLNVR